MRKILAICLIIVLVSTPLSSIKVNAQSSNPNLFVSAEQSLFGNHFSGSMVVEVIVRDSDIASLDNHHGEPDVTLNGKKLRMAQASDGNWYAFFANKDKAMQADQVASTGLAGQSLDFGAFCDRSTDASVLGVSFSETEGVAIPRFIPSSTQGTSSFSACTGPIPVLLNQNNVVRHPPSLNTNPSLPTGQIGLNPDLWPVIQLFSFHDNVSILYNKAGGSQRVVLYYVPEADIPNITLKLDRDGYPKGAEVFVTINDIQLNQDPTSVDSWTFNVNSTRATFYQAFTETGTNSGNGGLGLVDLNPHLVSLGFKDNGNLGMDLGSVVELRTNQRQPSNFVSSVLKSYNKIVTLVETEPNSGIFVSSDFNNKSTIGILSNAPRFQSGSIVYNSKSTSIVSATYTAKLSLGLQGGQFSPGQKVAINLVDPEQNLNPGARDDLDVFRSSATIPTLRIGNPVTLQHASDVKFYALSTTPLMASSGNQSVPSSVPDKNSDRLIIDTRSVPNGSFEKITLNLGITAQSLQDLFIDVSNVGTNWINYDLRSFQNQLGISSFSDTNMTLHFGGLQPSTTKIRILNAGDISGAKGLVQVTNSVVTTIKPVPSSLSVFLEISFDASADTTNTGLISNEQDTQPIVLDFFSFGNKNGVRVNNAIYRAELQETSNNSGIFVGTLEYTMINQLNQNDPALIRSLRTISNEIKFLSNDQLTDEKGVNLAYSDIQASGANVNVSTKTDVKTHSGTVTLKSQTYRLGQPVVVILNDPDLNTDNDSIQSYTVVNKPASAADDTVGDTSGNILLEVLIKGFRYHRCTINGVTHGGLASTGFTLVETGPATGVFKGSFKMPSQICNEDGTRLISPIGGNIRVKYHDFRDEFGQSNIFELTFPNSSATPAQKPLVEESLPKISVKAPQIKDSFNRPLLTNPVVGQDLNFVTEISNNDNQNSQSYSYIIQVKDHKNRIVELKWIEGKVNAQSKKDMEILWTPKLSGKYTVEVFVWDGIDSAVAIAKKVEYAINASPR